MLSLLISSKNKGKKEKYKKSLANPAMSGEAAYSIELIFNVKVS